MKVLVVVDMQNDFITGSLGTPEAVAIVGNVIRTVEEFDGNMICTTRDTHGDDYLETQEGRMLPVPHCKLYTDGWRLQPQVYAAIQKRLNEDGMKSQGFMKTSFGSPDLASTLHLLNNTEDPISEVVFVGLCTDICVISNVMLVKAYLPEAKITVLADCCAGVSPESHKRALEAMKVCQVNVVGDDDE